MQVRGHGETKYIFDGGRDGKAAKKIIAAIPDPGERGKLVANYLADGDKFTVQNGWALWFLASRINAYRAAPVGSDEWVHYADGDPDIEACDRACEGIWEEKSIEEKKSFLRNSICACGGITDAHRKLVEGFGIDLSELT